jgi:hypothetical protein
MENKKTKCILERAIWLRTRHAYDSGTIAARAFAAARARVLAATIVAAVFWLRILLASVRQGLWIILQVLINGVHVRSLRSHVAPTSRQRKARDRNANSEKKESKIEKSFGTHCLTPCSRKFGGKEFAQRASMDCRSINLPERNVTINERCDFAIDLHLLTLAYLCSPPLSESLYQLTWGSRFQIQNLYL